MPEFDRGLLRESLREAESVLDKQLHTMDELDDKTEQFLGLGIGTAGAGVALLAFVSTVGHAGIWFMITWLPALVFNFASLTSFAIAYVGAPNEPSGGPSLDWLAEKANDPDWTLEDHIVNLLRGDPKYFATNLMIIRGEARARRWGLGLLIAAGALYAGAAAFVLAEATL